MYCRPEKGLNEWAFDDGMVKWCGMKKYDWDKCTNEQKE